MQKYTGKTLEDTLKYVKEEKHCDLDEITYNVIEEKKGILGIGNSVTIEAYTPYDVKEFLFNYIGDFFTGINQSVEIEIIELEDKLKVVVNAENNAVVIGKGGRTLQSINIVVRNAVNSEFKKRINVLVDVNNYKEDKYRREKRVAQGVARSVKKTRIAASLDPMSSDERKVVHQYLSEFPNIKTESEGMGRDRHIVIKYVEEVEGSEETISEE
jgi:spoIIIJ-associated protein